MELLVDALADSVRAFCVEIGARPVALGLGFPGILRDGVVQESPNLRQAKGAPLRKSAFAGAGDPFYADAGSSL